jgi:hypothetical protein
VRETRRQVIDFHREIVQNLKPWQAKAPKLPEAPDEVPVCHKPSRPRSLPLTSARSETRPRQGSLPRTRAGTAALLTEFLASTLRGFGNALGVSHTQSRRRFHDRLK